MNQKNSFFLSLFFLSGFMLAQNQPELHSLGAKPGISVPIEAMVGNKRFSFNSVLIKRFGGTSKFGFLSVLTYMADYKNDAHNQDFIATATVSYSLTKHFALVSGISINSTTGFRGTAGLQYLYTTPTWLIVVMPVIDINKTYNIEPLGIVEYKPKISENVRLYTKIQGYYNHETKDNLHARSYVHARLGVTKDIFTLGVAVNEDWYGPEKIIKENYGIFARVVFK